MSAPLKIVLIVALVGALAVVGVLAAVHVLGSPATAADSAAAAPAGFPSPASSQPPAWLLAEARRLVPDSADARVDAVYWGTPHDPELGDLTSSGPDDPSTWAYVLVFVGDLPPSGHSLPLSPTAGSPGPEPRSRWLLYIFDDVTHELGVIGEGRGEFDAASYPSLLPLEL